MSQEGSNEEIMIDIQNDIFVSEIQDDNSSVKDEALGLGRSINLHQNTQLDFDFSDHLIDKEKLAGSYDVSYNVSELGS